MAVRYTCPVPRSACTQPFRPSPRGARTRCSDHRRHTLGLGGPLEAVYPSEKVMKELRAETSTQKIYWDSENEIVWGELFGNLTTEELAKENRLFRL